MGLFKKQNETRNLLHRKKIKYTINSKGFRGKEFNIKKDKVRIIAFGGSTTIGLESSDEETYPSQLEKFLNKKNKENYEVLNMGFGSKSLNYIKDLFFSEAYKYEPDIIIIYSNRNSLMYDGGKIDPTFEGNRIIKVNYFLQQNVMTYKLLFKIYKKILNLSIQSNFFATPFG